MRRPHQILLATCLVLLSAFGQIARAASLEELQTLQDSGYRLASQMFMYVILEKAADRRKDVNRLVGIMDPRVAALGNAEVTTQWQALRASVIADPFYNGEVAQQKLYTIEDNATRFAQSLERLMPADAGPKKMAVHDLVRRMQVMMMIYLRNSADPLGGSNYAGINRELELEKLPAEFTTKLAEVEKTQPAMAPVLAKIKPKWTFLSPRLANYNEKTVPYLVDLYGRQTIDLLTGTAPL